VAAATCDTHMLVPATRRLAFSIIPVAANLTTLLAVILKSRDSPTCLTSRLIAYPLAVGPSLVIGGLVGVIQGRRGWVITEW